MSVESSTGPGTEPGAECFALLDDASPDGLAAARSRLYTSHAATLRCHDLAGWQRVLEQMETALGNGQHAVTLCAYELGAHILGMQPHAAADPAAPLAQILIFNRCDLLSQAEVAAWLAAQSEADDTPAGIAGIHANVGQQQFTDAINRIRDYIAAGDTYQVNYTYRLRLSLIHI